MKLLLPFSKYHGLGNDFVIIDARELARDNSGLLLLNDWQAISSNLARFICDRNFGIGADGLILGLPLRAADYELVDKSQGKRSTGDYPKRHDRDESSSEVVGFATVEKSISAITEAYPNSETCDLAWVYTNSDGSQADMCGNGLRALSLWTVNNLEPEADSFKIATTLGPVTANVEDALSIKVEIGKPLLESRKIPVAGPEEKVVLRHSLSLEKQDVTVTCVGMGNPHAVLFGQFEDQVKKTYEQLNQLDSPNADFFPERLKSIAQDIQESQFFPKGVNVEFVHQVSDSEVEVLVYERGCGATLACASGACAVVVAGVLEERLKRKAVVHLPGGDLTITWDSTSEKITMQGAAREVFSGLVWIDISEITKRRIALSNA